jgi:hypothetical protein
MGSADALVLAVKLSSTAVFTLVAKACLNVVLRAVKLGLNQLAATALVRGNKTTWVRRPVILRVWRKCLYSLSASINLEILFSVLISIQSIARSAFCENAYN